MRDEPLVHEVVLVDPPVALARVEDVHRLAGRKPLQVRHADLDREAAARLQMRGGVAKAGDLLGLRRQVVDRVEDEVHELERPFDARVREVADRHRDPVAARLLAQPGDHRVREVDAVHLHPTLRQGQREPAGTDPELERPPAGRELGQQRDGGLDNLR